MRWRSQRLVQVLAGRCYALTRISDFADRGCSAFTGPLIAAANRIKADLYIAHYPAALPAAALAARQHGARYAFDAEDFHLGDYPEGPAQDTLRGMIRAVEGRYLPGAAYVTDASPGIADAYAESYGVPRPTVVLNVFPLSQAPAGPTLSGTAEPGPSVYWFSQTIGPDRGLECAVRAIARARSRPHLYLRGSLAAGFLERLREIAAEVGVADHLHVLPPAMPSEMERLAAVYDVAFSGEPSHTPNNRIALGNKLFSNLLAGLPLIVSMVPSHCVFAEDFVPAVQLYPVDDVDALAKTLDGLLLSPTRLAQARAAAFKLGQNRFNWEREQTVVLDIVRRATKETEQ